MSAVVGPSTLTVGAVVDWAAAACLRRMTVSQLARRSPSARVAGRVEEAIVRAHARLVPSASGASEGVAS